MKNSINKPDGILIVAIIVQLIIGIAFMHSISGSYSEQVTGNYYSFFHHYLWDLLLSIIAAGFVFYYYSPTTIQKYSNWILATTFLLLSIALMPDATYMLATKLGLKIGTVFIYILPLVTLLLIVSASHYISTHYNHNTVRSAPTWIILSFFFLICILILNQPNSSGIAILGILLIAMCFSAKLYKVSGLLLLLLLLFIAGIEILDPYRLARVMSFLDPYSDRFGSGYSLSMSLSAIGGGDLLGVGYGEGIIKQHLPDAFDGFIFSAIVEEAGFVGALIITLCSVTIQWRSFAIAQSLMNNKRIYESIVVIGLSSWLSVLSILHIAVCLGLIPTHYVPYPLISSDHTYLMTTLIGLAIILRTGMTVMPNNGSGNSKKQPVPIILLLLFSLLTISIFNSSILDHELSEKYYDNVDIYKNRPAKILE